MKKRIQKRRRRKQRRQMRNSNAVGNGMPDGSGQFGRKTSGEDRYANDDDYLDEDGDVDDDSDRDDDDIDDDEEDDGALSSGVEDDGYPSHKKGGVIFEDDVASLKQAKHVGPFWNGRMAQTHQGFKHTVKGQGGGVKAAK